MERNKDGSKDGNKGNEENKESPISNLSCNFDSRTLSPAGRNCNSCLSFPTSLSVSPTPPLPGWVKLSKCCARFGTVHRLSLAACVAKPGQATCSSFPCTLTRMPKQAQAHFGISCVPPPPLTPPLSPVPRPCVLYELCTHMTMCVQLGPREKYATSR